MWTMTVRCAVGRCGSSLKRTMGRWLAQRMASERAARMDEGAIRVAIPDILEGRTFSPMLSILRVCAVVAFGCLQKQNLSLLSQYPLPGVLVDGNLTDWLTPTHTHENRYPHPHRVRRRPCFLPAADPSATTTTGVLGQVMSWLS